MPRATAGSMSTFPDTQVTTGDEPRRRAIIGPILSIIATVLYIVTYVTLVFNPDIEIPVNFITIILVLAFSPFIIFFIIIGIIMIILLLIGMVLNIVGKTKAGGIIMIIASCLGVFFAAFSYFVPLALGIAGGILCIVKK